MPLLPPPDMVGRKAEWVRLQEFATSGESSATLGIVWGRRRTGKSFLLEALVDRADGFYYETVRGSSAEALRELGARLAAYQGAAAPLALEDWDTAVRTLIRVGERREVTVAIDEYPYLLEHTPQLDSIIQRAFGPRNTLRSNSRTRLLLCGSAIAVMSRILSGTAPLRGRAGLDLRISPFDFRIARHLHGIEDLQTAFRVYAVIGGVAAYAREMVAGDLPSDPGDFDRWVCRRVLSPAAPLFNEVGLLLSEDPSTAKARKINLYHAALAGAATGHHTHRSLTSYVKVSGASLTPIIDALTATELIERIHDPIRENRPSYHPADPLIRFHYALIRRYGARFARHDADALKIWRHVTPTFESQVLGPCFEATARYWCRHFADPSTLGSHAEHVGPTTVSLADGTETEVDVVIAEADAETPSQRTIRTIGEAKWGERISERHLRRLDGVREALGGRARGAKLLLFGTGFSPGLAAAAARRPDLELIDLERLYLGA